MHKVLSIQFGSQKSRFEDELKSSPNMDLVFLKLAKGKNGSLGSSIRFQKSLKKLFSQSMKSFYSMGENGEPQNNWSVSTSFPKLNPFYNFFFSSSFCYSAWCSCSGSLLYVFQFRLSFSANYQMILSFLGCLDSFSLPLFLVSVSFSLTKDLRSPTLQSIFLVKSKPYFQPILNWKKQSSRLFLEMPTTLAASCKLSFLVQVGGLYISLHLRTSQIISLMLLQRLLSFLLSSLWSDSDLSSSSEYLIMTTLSSRYWAGIIHLPSQMASREMYQSCWGLQIQKYFSCQLATCLIIELRSMNLSNLDANMVNLSVVLVSSFSRQIDLQSIIHLQGLLLFPQYYKNQFETPPSALPPSAPSSPTHSFHYYNCDFLLQLSNMSFMNKIVEKKGLVIAAVGAALAIGAAFLYQSYQNQDKETPVQAAHDELNLEKQINGLKSQINLSNPSLDDIKEVLSFSMNFAKKKIFAYSREFKKRRQQFDSTTRKANMKDYMNVISNGMEEVRNIATNTQAEILKEIGLSEATFIKYQSQLGAFMQQLMMSQGQSDAHVKDLTLEEVKYAIRLQIEYLRTEGEEILDKILEATKNWPVNKKSQLPLLLSVVIADGAFEGHPQIDEEAVQAAQMKLQHHLMGEMQELQQVMTPLMRKLSAEIGGMGMMGGMGGMGGMPGAEDMEGFGGISMEQMQQLQQLQQLRLQDPVAFQEMMRNMYG